MGHYKFDLDFPEGEFAERLVRDLYKACHDDFGMQPAAVNKELNVKSASDIAELPRETAISRLRR